MKRTAIMKGTPPCQAPEQISEKVQAVSQIVNFDGKEILNMDLFYMGKLRGRYFADKEEKNSRRFCGWEVVLLHDKQCGQSMPKLRNNKRGWILLRR